MQPAGVAAKKARTHCKHGHEYTPANTYMDGNARGCKACRKVNKQRYLAKLRRARA